MYVAVKCQPAEVPYVYLSLTCREHGVSRDELHIKFCALPHACDYKLIHSINISLRVASLQTVSTTALIDDIKRHAYNF